MKKTYETYCAICRYYRNNWCLLWDVEITDPNNSHCESFRRNVGKIRRVQTRNK